MKDPFVLRVKSFNSRLKACTCVAQCHHQKVPCWVLVNRLFQRLACWLGSLRLKPSSFVKYQTQSRLFESRIHITNKRGSLVVPDTSYSTINVPLNSKTVVTEQRNGLCSAGGYCSRQTQVSQLLVLGRHGKRVCGLLRKEGVHSDGYNTVPFRYLWRHDKTVNEG